MCETYCMVISIVHNTLTHFFLDNACVVEYPFVGPSAFAVGTYCYTQQRPPFLIKINFPNPRLGIVFSCRKGSSELFGTSGRYLGGKRNFLSGERYHSYIPKCELHSSMQSSNSDHSTGPYVLWSTARTSNFTQWWAAVCLLLSASFVVWLRVWKRKDTARHNGMDVMGIFCA